jgi:hypothetical protein
MRRDSTLGDTVKAAASFYQNKLATKPVNIATARDTLGNSTVVDMKKLTKEEKKERKKRLKAQRVIVTNTKPHNFFESEQNKESKEIMMNYVGFQPDGNAQKTEEKIVQNLIME